MLVNWRVENPKDQDESGQQVRHLETVVWVYFCLGSCQNHTRFHSTETFYFTKETYYFLSQNPILTTSYTDHTKLFQIPPRASRQLAQEIQRPKSLIHSQETVCDKRPSLAPIQARLADELRVL